MIHVCPTCGRPVALDGANLSRIQSRIFNAVLKAGEISGEDLRAIVWRNDPNGGPDHPKTLHTHIWHLNQKLAEHGLRVCAGKGPGALYRVLKTTDDWSKMWKKPFELTASERTEFDNT